MKTLPFTVLLSLATGLIQPASAALPEPIATFADEYTVCVARIDPERLDPQAWTDAILDAAPDQRTALAEPLGQFVRVARTWLDQFRAAGGRNIHALLSLSYLGTEPPVLLIATVAPGGDAARLQDVLAPIARELHAESRVLSGCVAIAPAGVWRLRESSSLRPPSARLAEALADSEPALATVTFAPYAEASRVLEELMPRLPMVVGGGSSTVLGQGVQWAKLTLQPPPAVALEAVVRSRDGAAAAALQEICQRGLNAIGTIPEVRHQAAAWPDIQTALTPVVDGNSLRVQLGREQLTTIARQLLAPALTDARRKAARIMVLNQLKQLALGLIMYADDHQQQLPAHLVDILPYIGTANVLLAPNSAVEPPADLQQQDRAAQVAWVDAHSPFILHLREVAMKSIQSPSTTLLVYQKTDTAIDGQVGAAFADGHAELMSAQKLAEKLK